MDIEKTTYISGLYDVYGNLLTEKQKKTFKLYFFEDFSLGEIANYMKISRSAVYDQINKTVKILEKYEFYLKKYKKRTIRMSLIEKLKSVKDLDEIKGIIKELENNEE